MAMWIHGARAVLMKELRMEWRSRHAINLLFMFVLSSLLLVVFALGTGQIEPPLQAALLWIVIVFSAAVGLGRSFLAEEEQGTLLLLQVNVPGSQVLAGKLAFNLVLIMAVMSVTVVAFMGLMGMRIVHAGLLLATLGLGSVGLAGATTLLGALIAKASARGPLLPVLLFPMLSPLFLSVVRATQEALTEGATWSGSATDLTALVGFAGVVNTAAFLLFEYVWTD
ncbi:MAG: heme ABC transporter permease CcmB [Bacteroidetes bacterium CG12_big_fil_rev_8_21_14_0_65_60_17]|nr:MAG: heme ABC transporter permease CcmB [Bacteroidetes bacterium CG12_big_fil_rev_8_21_14_0_65_60_17]